jgi:hypothetical protein
MTHTFVRYAVVSMLALATTFAADQPNFSGEWKMNAAKSDFGQMAGNAPSAMSRKIEHKDADITATTTQSTPGGDRTTTSKYKTDGTETVNKMRTPQGEMDAKSTAKWDGNKLVITTNFEVQGNAITSTETWELSEDGKTLTANARIATPMGDLDRKIVMEKQ